MRNGFKMELVVRKAVVLFIVILFVAVALLFLAPEPASASSGVWVSQDSGTDDDILGVSGIDGTHVWAAGYQFNPSWPYYGIAYTEDQGLNWTPQESPNNVMSVSAYDATHAWAVTDDAVYFFNGSVWAHQADLSLGWESDIWAVDADHVWAVGDDGYMWHTDNGGANWVQQGVGLTADDFEGIYALI